LPGDIVEKTISQKTVEEVAEEISEKDSHGNKQIKDKLSDEELRKLSGRLRQSDEAGIPDEPFRNRYCS